MEDTLKKRSQKLQLSLYQSECSLSEVIQLKLQTEFLNGRPLSYILGLSEFYGSEFYVDENVLIPRPETELMVDLLVKEFGHKKNIQTLLDVGTGSGVILLSLLKNNVGIKGVGVDLSPAALKVAQTNSTRQRVPARFLESDRLSQVSETFDLIVSNPPYIKLSAHKNLVQRTVDVFEPKLALYLPDGEYEAWFREFFLQVKTHLNPQGIFMMEGHELELQTQVSLLTELGFQQAKVIKDYSGHDRFLKAQVI